MKRVVKNENDIFSAEDGKNEQPDRYERLKTATNDMEDDFEYFMAGIEKLSRKSAQDTDAALSILRELNGTMQEFIRRVADAINR